MVRYEDIEKYVIRFKKGIRRRVYNLHPLAILYEIRCRAFPDDPIIANFNSGIKARVWPGDTIGKQIYIGTAFESLEVDLFKSIVKPDMVVFDVGANLGYYSLIAAKRVARHGQVHSFEPCERMFEELEYNISINHFPNIYPNKLALGDKSGWAKLTKCERGMEVYSSLLPENGSSHASIDYEKVQISTMDDYVSRMRVDSVDVIKIDVEGAEYSVLKGAKKLLQGQTPPMLFFEVVQAFQAKFNYTSNDILSYLGTFGYKSYLINYASGKLTEVRGDVLPSDGNYLAVGEGHAVPSVWFK